MTTDASISNVNTELLEAVLDRLIPAIDDLPSAGRMGLTDEIVRLAAQQARFNRLFRGAMHSLDAAAPSFAKSVGDEQDAVIRAFESGSPELFRALLNICYIVYYKDPRVHKRIGWDSRPPQPEGNEMDPWDESVLDNIKKREPFWRRVE